MTRLRRDRLLAALVVAAAIGAGWSPARAADVEDPDPAAGVPTAELRMVAGTGFGVEAAGSILAHRLRLEGGVHAWIKGSMGEAAVLVRVFGQPANALWVRAGFLHHSINYSCGISDDVDTWDGGAVYRKRWAGGSLFVIETGAEFLSRGQGFVCNDSVLPGGGGGLRVSTGGQFAITRGVGLYGRVGLRTSQHLIEIGPLPELWAGFAFEI
jgi:hypothetical protein